MNAIQKVYGNKADLQELSTRILESYKSLFPGAATLTVEEAFALAQVGHIQGLDVFNKEIYYLKQVRNGETKSIGVMPGIRGLRKHARRQIRYEGGRAANFWFDFVQIIDREEKARAGAGESDLVVKGFLRDTVTMQAYLSMRQTIFSNLSSWGDLLKLSREDSNAVGAVSKAIEESAKEILGPPPIIVSYGIIKTFELKKDGDKIARPLVMVNGQNPYYMAEIRAERRGLYKRFDLEKSFGTYDDESVQIAEAIDAEIEEAETIEEPAAPAAPDTGRRTLQQNLSTLGF